ncbi:hypothetical protein AB3S75_029029 [Citrus x aurantiifolia]
METQIAKLSQARALQIRNELSSELQIINLLNENGLDPDFSVQTIYEVQTQQLPIHHMSYNFRNHVAENSFSRVTSTTTKSQFAF